MAMLGVAVLATAFAMLPCASPLPPLLFPFAMQMLCSFAIFLFRDIAGLFEFALFPPGV